MTDKTVPRRSRRLGLRRAAAPAVEAPKRAEKAAVVAPAAPKAAPKTTQAKPLPPLPPLNARQKLFIEHYLITKNGTQSAIKAGYSRKGADVHACRLLAHPSISAEISKRLNRVLEKLAFTADTAIEELANMGRANMQDYFKVGPNGTPTLDWSNLTRAQAAALQELTVEEFVDGRSDKRQVRRVKFKLADKQGAIDLWGKYKGVYVEKHEHHHTVSLVGTLLDEIDAAARGGKVIEHQAQEKPNG